MARSKPGGRGTPAEPIAALAFTPASWLLDSAVRHSRVAKKLSHIALSYVSDHLYVR